MVGWAIIFTIAQASVLHGSRVVAPQCASVALHGDLDSHRKKWTLFEP